MSTYRRAIATWTCVVSILTCACVFLAGSAAVPAADRYWSGTGTWDTSTTNWGTTTGGPYNAATWSNSPADSAFFEGTSGTVTLGTAITAAQLTFSIDDYALTGSAIALNTSGTSINAAASATIASNVTLGTGQSWAVTAGETLTLGGVVSGAQTLAYRGAGTFALSGINSNSGNLTIDAATVSVATGATLYGSGLGYAKRTVTLQNGGTLVATNYANGAGNFWGEIGDDNNNVTFGTGGGTFRFIGTAMDSTVNKGFLVNAGVAGTFAVPVGVSGTWGGSYGGRDFTVSSGGTLAFGVDGRFTTSRIVSGAGRLLKTGTGTLILNGASTISGTTTVSQGTLQIGDGGTSGSLASANVVTDANLVYSFSTSGAATLPSGSLTGTGNLSVTARDVNLGGGINLGTSGTVTITQVGGGVFPNGINLGAASRTITGREITLSGDVGNTAADGGSLALDTSGANGPISLNISLGRSGVFFVPNALTASSGTGTISVIGSGPASSGWRTQVTLDGRIAITANVNSATTVTLNETTASGSVSGTLSGGMSLVKGGVGTLTLAAVNSFTGPVTVNTGTLAVGIGTSGGSASGLGNGSNTVTVGPAGALLFSGGSRTSGYHTGAVNVNGGTITFDTADNSFGAGNTTTFGTSAGTVSGTGQWRLRAGATVRVLAAANGSTIGVRTLDLYDSTGTFNVDTAAILTVSSSLTNEGGGALAKSGGGTLRLTAVNSGFGGGVTVNSGTLDVAVGTSGGADSGLGNGSNTITIGSTGTLLFSGGARTAGYHSGAVNVNGGTITFDTNDNSFASGRTLTFGAAAGTVNGTGMWRRRDANNKITVDAGGSGSVISVAELNLLDNAPTFEVANGAAAYDLTISGGISGGATLTKTGAGVLAITGSNGSFTGSTAINAGTLRVAGAGGLGSSGSVTIGSSGTLGLAPGVAFSRPLSITSGGKVDLGANASVVLPNAAALAAFTSRSTNALATTASILYGSGSATPTSLTSNWTTITGDYFSDVLSLEGTGTGNVYVLSMTYDPTAPDPSSLNIWYRSGTSGSFTPVGTSSQGSLAWSSSYTTPGQYGVDTSTGTVWAVSDHNSQFVIVPEPSAPAWAAVGLAGLAAGWIRRRR